MGFLLIVFVLVLNFCLGFVAAASLGRGPRNWQMVRQALSGKPIDCQAPGSQLVLQQETDHQLVIQRGHQLAESLKSAVNVDDPVQLACLQLIKDCDSLRLSLDMADQQIKLLHGTDNLSSWKSMAQQTADDVSKIASNLKTEIQSVGCLDGVSDVKEINYVFSTIESFTGDFANDLGSLEFDAENPEESAGRCETLVSAATGNCEKQLRQLRDVSLRMATCSFQDLDTSALEQMNDRDLGRVALEIRRGREEADADQPSPFLGILQFDNLTSIKQGYGRLAVRLLYVKLLEELLGWDDLPVEVCLDDDRFLIRGRCDDMSQFAEHVEKVRQSVEHTRWAVGETKVQVSCSAIVTADSIGDELPKVLSQLELFLTETDGYGGNRTFLCEDGAATPVIPPEIEVQEQVLAL